MIETLSKTQAPMMNTHHQAINRLEVQIGQLATSLNERQKETLPSQPLPNPKNPFPVHEAEDIGQSQCNTVHILRSGKRIDNQVSNQPNNQYQYPHLMFWYHQLKMIHRQVHNSQPSNPLTKTKQMSNHTSLLYHFLIG